LCHAFVSPVEYGAPEGTAWLPPAVSMEHQRPVVMKLLQNPGQNGSKTGGHPSIRHQSWGNGSAAKTTIAPCPGAFLPLIETS
jgi:hypothetical protein